MTTASWTRVLDDCEARLDALAATMTTATPPEISPFLPVATAEPIPAELVPRARALVDRSAELEQRLANERDRVRAELRRLPRMPRTPGPGSEALFEVKA
jgi:hypothetical protein